MIEVEAIASSSNGNCYRLISGTHELLLEAGLPFKAIKAAVKYQLGRLDGCLISHEHGDHSASVAQLIKTGVDVYMTTGTAAALRDNAKGASILLPDEQGGYRARSLGSRYWTIKPFRTFHDAQEPVGFLISDKDDMLLFATDTCAVPWHFNVLSQVMIECNYLPQRVEERVAAGAISFKQAQRLLGSHMSLDACLDFFRVNAKAMSYCRQIFLLHGSRENGDPKVFKEAVQRATGKPVIVCAP